MSLGAEPSLKLVRYVPALVVTEALVFAPGSDLQMYCLGAPLPFSPSSHMFCVTLAEGAAYMELMVASAVPDGVPAPPEARLYPVFLATTGKESELSAA